MEWKPNGDRGWLITLRRAKKGPNPDFERIVEFNTVDDLPKFPEDHPEMAGSGAQYEAAGHSHTDRGPKDCETTKCDKWVNARFDLGCMTHVAIGADGTRWWDCDVYCRHTSVHDTLIGPVYSDLKVWDLGDVCN